MPGRNAIIVFFALFLAAAAGPTARAQDAPHSLRWRIDELTETKKLEFTVMTDDLSISRVIVNKGNCQIATTFNGAIELKVNDAFRDLGQVLAGKKIETFPQKTDPNAGLPLTGVFGERLSVFVPRSCNILLVEVETDRGNWTHRFQPR